MRVLSTKQEVTGCIGDFTLSVAHYNFSDYGWVCKHLSELRL